MPHPDRPGPSARGCSYRRVLCATAGTAVEEGLGHGGGAEQEKSRAVPRREVRGARLNNELIVLPRGPQCIPQMSDLCEHRRIPLLETVWKLSRRGPDEARSLACDAKIRPLGPSMPAHVAPVWCTSGLSRQSLEDEFCEVRLKVLRSSEAASCIAHVFWWT